MAGVGLLLAWISRTPGTRLLVLWLLQVPNLLGLVVVPVLVSLARDGRVELTGGLQFGLKLGFAWSPALFVSILLFSSMQIGAPTR